MKTILNFNEFLNENQLKFSIGHNVEIQTSNHTVNYSGSDWNSYFQQYKAQHPEATKDDAMKVWWTSEPINYDLSFDFELKEESTKFKLNGSVVLGAGLNVDSSFGFGPEWNYSSEITIDDVENSITLNESHLKDIADSILNDAIPKLGMKFYDAIGCPPNEENSTNEMIHQVLFEDNEIAYEIAEEIEDKLNDI